MQKHSRLIWLFVAVAVVALAGCGIPKEVRKDVKAIKEEIAAAEKSVTDYDTAYQAFLKKPEFKSFARYQKSDDWDDNFSVSKEHLATATKSYYHEVLPLLKRNDPKELSQLRSRMKGVRDELREAKALAQRPSERMKMVQETQKNGQAMIAESSGKVGQLNGMYNAVYAKVSQAKLDYPGKSNDLTGRLAPLTNTWSGGNKALGTAKGQWPSGDLLIVADSCMTANKSCDALQTTSTALTAKIAELYRSYSKTLIDMKVDERPWKQVVKYEWSEWSDWDDTHEVSNEKIPITPEEYRQLAPQLEQNEDGIQLSSGFGEQTLLEDVDIDATYYHKYRVTEGSRVTDTDWQVVNEQYYTANEDNLGMDVVVKPLGAYEEEAVKSATPPAMAYVGNPAYGQWSGSGNNQFWVWYGQWRFFDTMLGGSRYSYNDYNDWNRNYRSAGKPYYGTVKDEDRWGSSSAHASTRYAGSNYVRTGGATVEEPSVRGAGPSARGGGPGGGGK